MDRGRATGFRGLVVAAASLLLNAGLASAATIRVTTTSDPAGTNQCSLREAIATANSPGTPTVCGTADAGANTIVLGPNTYTLSIPATGSEDNTNGDLVVVSSAPLTISGAGAGRTQILAAAALRDRVLTVALGRTVTLTGLTISGGHAPDGAAGPSPSSGNGGAGGAGADGGGILNLGSLSLAGAAVLDNNAGSGGAGGNGGTGSPSAGNGGAGGRGGAGGGIYSTGTLALSGARIIGNQAGAGGNGGIGHNGGPDNGGNGADGGCCGDGGGIENAGGLLVITDSTISFNRAGDGGSGGDGGDSNGFGASAGAGGTGQGGSSGGGIASAGGSLSITNSTLSSNASGAGGNGGTGGPIFSGTGGAGGAAGNGSAGGAVFVSGGGTATLLNVTVDLNRPASSGVPGNGGAGGPNGPLGAVGSPAFGGGVYANNSTMTVTNTLLASNQLGNCAARGSGGITDGGFNLSFGDSTCPGNFASGDPKLGVLQDNGGPTETIRLGAGSAAIDKIPVNGANCPSTDQRGVPRPRGPRCDIGAYEVAPPDVNSGGVTNLSQTSATLNGSVAPFGAAATVRFQIGATPGYATETPSAQVAGVSPVAVTAMVTGLRPGTTYHYREVATNPDGTTLGADRTFTTPLAPKPVKPTLHAHVNHRQRSAKFSFGGRGATGFQCALVRSRKKRAKPHYATCRSPKTYKHLAKGSYRFLVRGIDAAGTGPTAVFRFTL